MLAAVDWVHAGVASDVSLYQNASKTLPALAPAVLAASHALRLGIIINWLQVVPKKSETGGYGFLKS